MRINVYLIGLSVLSAVAVICSGHNVGYAIASTEQLSYYHYPTPRGAQLHETSSSSSSSSTHPHDDAIEQYFKQQNKYHPHHHHSSATATIAKEFASSMLENAAFTMALTRQGYVVVDAGVMAAPMIPSAPLVATTNAMFAHPRSKTHSQNVKLPLPLGITPITFAPLPLQAGAPYSTVRGLTSYGTPYPQRRR